jgi:hypothetical protein
MERYCFLLIDFTESTNFFDPVPHKSSSIELQPGAQLNGKLHQGFREMSRLFIESIKHGKVLERVDAIFVWYRTQSPIHSASLAKYTPKLGKIKDVVHIASWFQENSEIHVNFNDKRTVLTAHSEWYYQEVPFEFGNMQVSVYRNGKMILNVPNLSPIEESPLIYDLNYHSSYAKMLNL